MMGDEYPQEPPAEYEYALVEDPAGGVGDGNVSIWELCSREYHRVERTKIDEDEYWTCLDCDLVRSTDQDMQATLDGRVVPDE